MDWIAILIAIGAAHAVMLTAYAAVSAQRRSGHAWLATLFAVLAVGMTAILVTHRTEGWPESAAIVVEGIAAWLAGPVLFALVRAATDEPLSATEIKLHFGAVAGLIVGSTMLSFAPEFGDLHWPVVLYEVAYSTASAITFARNRQPNDRSARAYWWPLAALIAMFSIHAGQAVRLTMPQAGLDAVPLMGGLSASLILLALLLTQAQRVNGPRYARSSLSAQELGQIFALIEDALDGPSALYRKMDLTLADLSAAVSAQPHHASQALSDVGKTSFHETITARRVRDAQRRLLDPSNANVAVEALGMESGFRSRSVFYAAFKAATGGTPADFRRQNAKTVSGTARQDQDPRAGAQSGA